MANSILDSSCCCGHPTPAAGRRLRVCGAAAPLSSPLGAAHPLRLDAPFAAPASETVLHGLLCDHWVVNKPLVFIRFARITALQLPIDGSRRNADCGRNICGPCSRPVLAGNFAPALKADIPIRHVFTPSKALNINKKCDPAGRTCRSHLMVNFLIFNLFTICACTLRKNLL